MLGVPAVDRHPIEAGVGDPFPSGVTRSRVKDRRSAMSGASSWRDDEPEGRVRPSVERQRPSIGVVAPTSKDMAFPSYHAFAAQIIEVVA